jgi:hypothetical protein
MKTESRRAFQGLTRRPRHSLRMRARTDADDPLWPGEITFAGARRAVEAAGVHRSAVPKRYRAPARAAGSRSNPAFAFWPRARQLRGGQLQPLGGTSWARPATPADPVTDAEGTATPRPHKWRPCRMGPGGDRTHDLGLRRSLPSVGPTLIPSTNQRLTAAERWWAVAGAGARWYFVGTWDSRPSRASSSTPRRITTRLSCAVHRTDPRNDPIALRRGNR